MMKICIGSFLAVILVLIPSSHESQGLKFRRLGCFKDVYWPKSSKALPVFLGVFHNPKTSVKMCAAIALKKGYTTFGIQKGVLCWSGKNAEKTHKRYGKAKICRGGTGGSLVNVVYQFPGQARNIISLKNTLLQQGRIITTLKNKLSGQGRTITTLRSQYRVLSGKDSTLTRSITSLRNRIGNARVSCYNTHSNWDKYSDAYIKYLDRQYVNCPKPYFLANFVLRRQADRSHALVRYIFRCCKFVL